MFLHRAFFIQKVWIRSDFFSGSKDKVPKFYLGSRGKVKTLFGK